jgi:hypothetical protein|tara:strand:+ start:6441 stop:6602 length:162 start_codon:yes stop_codon:yes gene_type:complete
MSKSLPENRRALAKPEYGAVTTTGQPVTGEQRPGFGKHTKGKVSPYNKKKKRK